MKSRWVFVLLIAGLICGGSVLVAQGKGKGKGKGKNHWAGDEPVFSVEERQVITGWYRDDRRGLPPGLAKKDRLPPGLEKQLRERGTLPPGLAKKVQPLPPVLERRLPVLPTGYRRVMIGGDIIIMNARTSFICDILRIAVP